MIHNSLILPVVGFVLFIGVSTRCRTIVKRLVGPVIRALPFGKSFLSVLKREYRRGKCIVWTHAPLLRPGTRAGLLARLGAVLVQEEDFEAAVELLSQAIGLSARCGRAYLWRGRALQRQKRLAEAAEDYRAALDRTNLTPTETRLLYEDLAKLFVSLGEVDRAIVHQAALLRLQRGRPDGKPDADDAGRLQLLIEAHDHLAESVINSRGDFDGALDIYRRKRRLQRQFAETFGLADNPVVFLPDDWVRNIGHMALLDFWAKMRHLGWRPSDRIVLLAPKGATANDAYLRYWKSQFTVVTERNQIRPVSFLANALGNRVAGMLELPDGREKYFCEGMGAVQEAWEEAGRPPLLRLRPDDEERGREVLARLGMPRDAWFVCLHVRSAGFHNEGAARHQAHRNADIRSYLPAVREIAARGGWVVRLGDDTMPPLPPTPGLIDYAHSTAKSAAMDIFLCAACRFFIGVASGLSHVPTTFGVPCLLTNWVSNALPVRSRLDRFIPKLIRSDVEDRYLTFRECLEPSVRALSYCGVKLAEAGVRAVDNPPEEILDAVREMFEILEGRAEYTAEDERLRRAFHDTAVQCGLVGFSRVGRAFLRRHAHLAGQGAEELRRAG